MTTMAMTTLALTKLDVQPIAGGVGVEIGGVDLAQASRDQMQAIRATYDQNPIVVLRDQQHLSVEQHVAFGRVLGALVPHTRLEYTVPGYPEVYVLSNKKQDGRSIGVHLDGLGWHSDGTYLANPLAATTLHALDVPPEGGDTLFADTCRAYENLSDAMRARIEDMVVVYDFVFYMQTRFPDYVITEQQRRENPPVRHRLVRRDAAGRPGLYMSNGSARGIDGMTDEDGRAFLRELTDFVTQERHVYRHRWRAGDLVIWNNLQTMHSATLYDDTRYERLLHRLWVKAGSPA